MSWQVAAARVEEGDPDRFAATMIAPVAVRAKLFPLYALNLELAEAAWASPEPLVCLMRLQFWEDAVVAFRDGRMMPAHDLTPALAEALQPDDVAPILRLIDWRRRESHRLGFDDLASLLAFLEGTSGGLMALAAAKLGAKDGHVARQIGRAMGLANWLAGFAALEAQGARPLPMDGHGIADLAQAGLDALDRADQLAVPKSARAALWPAFGARITLGKALRNPGLVKDGRLGKAPLTRSLLLIGTRLTGRV
jgi:15-cis-phytoene synthase